MRRVEIGIGFEAGLELSEDFEFALLGGGLSAPGAAKPYAGAEQSMRGPGVQVLSSQVPPAEPVVMKGVVEAIHSEKGVELKSLAAIKTSIFSGISRRRSSAVRCSCATAITPEPCPDVCCADPSPDLALLQSAGSIRYSFAALSRDTLRFKAGVELAKIRSTASRVWGKVLSPWG